MEKRSFVFWTIIRKLGGGEIEGVPIFPPEKICDLRYDCVCIGALWVDEMVEQLVEIGVEWWRINTNYVVGRGAGAREVFLEFLSKEIKRKNVRGNVAEAGVFRGEFSKIINKFFPDRKIYLFDTFEGFDQRDIEKELLAGKNDLQNANYFDMTSEEIVMNKLPHPENAVIVKGYIPESLSTVEDQFAFINLDLDLYQPTLEALRFFYPRVSKGGGILIHDYFDEYTFPNLKAGVISFANEVGADLVPIGDGLSVFMTK